ncbi:MAG: hypothetical protein L0I88_01300 [Alkalibacterium sp.]|nr:hypothetical protein [Alkalibacterium sp.]
MDYIKIPHGLYKAMVLMEKELKEETQQQSLEILRQERDIDDLRSYVRKLESKYGRIDQKNATADSSDAK